jgi:hypothetical protein
MKRSVLLLLAAFTVISYAVAVGTKAILVEDSLQLETIEAKTASLAVALDFATDPSVKGIPGEATPLTTANGIVKEGSGMGIAFRVTYTATGATGYIKNLYLNDETALVKDEEKSDATTLVYYGVIKEKEEVFRDLGPLVVEFSTAQSEESSGQNNSGSFDVNAEILACQLDEEAISQTFGINTKGEIANLIY